jgi:hypothetical protein
MFVSGDFQLSPLVSLGLSSFVFTQINPKMRINRQSINNTMKNCGVLSSGGYLLQLQPCGFGML